MILVAGEVAIEGTIIPRVKSFRYLGSIIQENGEIDEDINHPVSYTHLTLPTNREV